MALSRKNPNEEFKELVEKKLEENQFKKNCTKIQGKQYTTYLKDHYAISFPKEKDKIKIPLKDQKKEAETYSPFTAIPLEDENGIKIYPKASLGTLAQVLINYPTHVKLQSLNLFMQLISAVSAFHEKGYAIGDIKPENILVFESNGQYILKLIDTNSIGKYTKYTNIPPEKKLLFAEAVSQIDSSDIQSLQQQDCYQVGNIFKNILKNETRQPYKSIEEICINLTQEKPENRKKITEIPNLLGKEAKKHFFEKFKKESTLKDIHSFDKNIIELNNALKANPKPDDQARLMRYKKQQANALISATTKFIKENPTDVSSQENGSVSLIKRKAENILQPTQKKEEKTITPSNTTGKNDIKEETSTAATTLGKNKSMLFSKTQSTQSSHNKFKFSFSVCLQCLRCLANFALLGLMSVFFFIPSNLPQPPTDDLKQNEEKSPAFRSKH